jgi:hypothetical protein
MSRGYGTPIDRHSQRRNEVEEKDLSKCCFYTTNPTSNGLEHKSDIRGDRQATTHVDHSTVVVLKKVKTMFYAIKQVTEFQLKINNV